MRPSVEEERREQLIAAAARVIARSGYDAATVRDVASEAGVSTGVIAYYFDGKDDLFAHVLRAASRDFRARLAHARSGAETPRERLLALAEAATPADEEAERAHALWIDFWARAARDPALAGLTVRLYDGWRREIADAVRDGQRAGAFRERCRRRGLRARLRSGGRRPRHPRGAAPRRRLARRHAHGLCGARRRARALSSRSTAPAAARSDPSAATRACRRTPGSAE